MAYAVHKLSTSTNSNMKTMNPTQHEESTYALLVRSEEEERSLPETITYLLLIACTAFAVWQSAQQPFKVPYVGVRQSAPIAQVAHAQSPHA
jgi:hypothetical protein